jgi:hypothetical protein
MKYRIELTDKQLHIVLRAVNLMMRTGMGQTDDLAEWLVTMGDKRAFIDYYSTRKTIKPVLDGVIYGCRREYNALKSESVNELETIYTALRHQEWLDSESKSEYDVRSFEPTQEGFEPIPKIERVE